MENERIEKINNLNETFEQNNIFKLDYAEQNIIKNNKYKLWKESILKKYGNNVKLFRCIQDKILFYASYDENVDDSIYHCRCPICKKAICYFCSSIDILKDMCCYKRSIYDLYFKKGLSFIEKVDKYEDIQHISQDYTILCMLIPGLNLFLNIFLYIDAALLRLITKDIVINDSGNREIYIDRYYRKGFGYFFTIPCFFMVILLSLVFFVLNFYIILFILLTSIPFKLYPLKYFLGITSGF